MYVHCSRIGNIWGWGQRNAREWYHTCHSIDHEWDGISIPCHNKLKDSIIIEVRNVHIVFYSCILKAERIQSQPYWVWIHEMKWCLSLHFIVHAAAFDCFWARFTLFYRHALHISFHSIAATIFPFFICNGISIAYCRDF